MTIREDKHLINEEHINKNWKRLDIHSLRITGLFTDEERESGIDIRKIKADRVKSLLEKLDKRYRMYQYHKPEIYSYSKDGYDLFFWCNHDVNAADYRDYTYVTLTFNDKWNTEQRMKLLKKIRSELSELDYNVDIVIQYDTQINEDVVNAEAEILYEKIKEKFIEVWGHCEGKFSKNENFDGYIFKKKRSRKYFYVYSPIEFLATVET